MKVTNVETATAAILGTLRYFIGPQQLAVIGDACRSEEMQVFFDKLTEYSDRIEKMPKTYETDGQGDNAIAYLHYFGGNIDAYITEKDMGDESGDKLQLQAFGKISIGGNDAELGYISIAELTSMNVELDLYWEPKPLKEC